MAHEPPRHFASMCITVCALTVGCGDTSSPLLRTLAYAVPPSSTPRDAAIAPAIQIEIRDAAGLRQTTATDVVTLALGANANGATLVGDPEQSAVGGIATFPNVGLTKSGSNYTLIASAGTVPPLESRPFNVVLRVAAIVAGGAFSCASATAEGTFCWGLNNTGQLGDGTTASSNMPIPISGALTFTALSAGGGHVCGLTGAGDVYCWGQNGSGELGIGTNEFSPIPARVIGGQTFNVLSDGGTVGSHTCAITPDSTAVCWGSNTGGQLGNGSMDDSSVPVPVSGGLKFVTLTTGGGAHSCGITTNAAAYCWGFNGDGRLGSGSTTNSDVPTPVAGGLRFASVSAGAAHTCGVTTTGAAYCWGNNSEGQLGNALGTHDSVPVAVVGGQVFSAVTGGLLHTCGRTTAGAGYCWGNGGAGQLGSGTGANSSSPLPVTGSLTFVVLRAGQFHTCGIATNGGAYCWGNNGPGQLGDGTNVTRRTPTLVLLVP